MTNKEKLNYLVDLLFKYANKTPDDMTMEEANNVPKYAKDITSNLKRLEKLEKAVAIVIKYNMINKDDFEYDFEEKETFYKDHFIKNADVDVVFEVFELEENRTLKGAGLEDDS